MCVASPWLHRFRLLARFLDFRRYMHIDPKDFNIIKESAHLMLRFKEVM